MNRLLERLAIGLIACTGITANIKMVSAETPPDVLVIADRIDSLITLDPAESYEFTGSDIIRNVYQKLINYYPDDLESGYQPEIAESWTVSSDGRTITFTIRDDIKFHSGNPVTSEDAAFSLQRAVILNKTPSSTLTQLGFTPENVRQTILADDDKLMITTDRPYAVSFVLNCLTASIGSIVDRETVMSHEVDGDMGNSWLKINTAGSGAYSVQSWKPNESVTLQANDGYSHGAPPMKRVVLVHTQESATQRLQLQRGDVDIARNLTPDDIAGIESENGIKVEEELKGGLMYVSLNQNHPILAKPEVRKAIKYLIDYDAMQDSFLKGQYRVHQNFIPTSFLGAVDDNPFELNVEKARELLESVGVGELEIEIGVRDVQDRMEIAQSLQNTFAQAGILLEISVATAKVNLGRYRARELDVYIGAWGPSYPDPHTNAGTFAYNPDNSLEANATGRLTWRNAWDAAGLTEKVERALTENDREMRIEMYQDIQSGFRDTSPFAIMFQQSAQTAMRDNVNGFSTGQAVTYAAFWQVTK
ncbi:ABC transporter substrate-binding protein [Labrenzia sp. DG1229]|uniref:ABC transporter substrate-binding protein n=1 Tax=Labrenzia sp. DG1229 TaxID=681847 RepID=UPI00049037C4|nr:ABC transporter substrate-binding protein [Labrenzia sp. DG1229]